MRRPILAIVLLLSCFVPGLAQEQPVILNCTESIRPGETIAIQGANFGRQPEVWLTIRPLIHTRPPIIRLRLVQQSENFLAAVLPKDLLMGIYEVWVKNGTVKSASVFINRPRIWFPEFNEGMPGGRFRIFGRNLCLEGANPRVYLRGAGQSGIQEAAVIKASPYELQLQLPDALAPGKYRVTVGNGAGAQEEAATTPDSLLIVPKEPIPFNSQVPWVAAFRFAQNIYDVKKDPRLAQHAAGDGIKNDRAAIQAAIDRAHADGGGIVQLPAGTYRIEYSSGCGLKMLSRVVLQGAGQGKTILCYGYGQPFSTERVKASYGWTLGWPDSREEGMGLVFPGAIQLSGLVGLSLQNVNESGNFMTTVKNMPEGGSSIILQDCHFDNGTGWGLAMVNIHQLLIENCRFSNTAIQVRGINGPTRTWPWDLKNSSQVSFRNNRHDYYAGRFGANGCQRAVFENNFFVRNGDHQSKHETGGLSLDYVKDIVVQGNSFDVTGAPIAVRNQGETILSQAGMAHQNTVGKVSAATANSITDNKNEYQDFTDRVSTDWQYVVHPTNYSIAIVNGKGAGQWRLITGNTDTSLTVDRPWDIIPEAGSQYIITQWSAWQMLIRNNILKGNNRGIWLYCGGNDIVVSGNQLINSEGIYIRADQRLFNNRYNIGWKLLVENNLVQNTNGIRPAYIAAYLAQVRSAKLWGTGILGLEVRRNTIEAFSPNVKTGWVKGEGYYNYVVDEEAKGPSRDKETPGILGTIFESNKAISAEKAYTYAAGAAFTVIADTLPDYSQEKAEMDALQKYETINHPRQYMPAPAPAANPDSLGARIARAASLLGGSTPKRRIPVKVLIYGQSITGSKLFTDYMREYLELQFPHAIVDLENRSIGGFGASQLIRVAPHDIYNTCADLVIFHVYGGEKPGAELDQLFSAIRKTSNADIILMGHHTNGNQQKPSSTTAEALRGVANRHQLEYVDISSEWPQYLTANQLQPKDLLRDNVHPNRDGNWLLVQLVGRHIRYDPAFTPNSGTVKQLPLGKSERQLIRFTGTRLDAVAHTATLQKAAGGKATLLLDGQPLSAYAGRYMITRPSAGPGTWWPAIRQVHHNSPLTPEEWTLEVTGINADSSVYMYTVVGSVTGPDGNGRSDSLFISRSGRVVIEPADIIFSNIKKTFRSVTRVGFQVKWAVAPAYPAAYEPPAIIHSRALYRTTLVSGLPNGPHTLELIPQDKGPLGIDYFEAYQPAN